MKPRAFKVHGAKKSDGRSIVASIIASDEAEAQKFANERGILVERLETEDDLNRLAEAQRTPLDYPARRIAGPVPSYAALHVIASVIIASGVLLMLAPLVIGAIAMSNAGSKLAGVGPMEFLILASIFISGLTLAAFGEALRCLRDIARNSFR